MQREREEEGGGRRGKRRDGDEMERRCIGEREKLRIHACHGTEQTRASRAYDGADAHLRLEDKHRHLYKLADTPGKKYRV